MTPVLFRDACFAAGTTMAACGAGMQWGLASGLMVGGALLLALTAYTFWGA